MYSCPTCKTQNHEHQKFCYKCGTWLQSTAYPAKKITNIEDVRKPSASNGSKKTGFIVPVIIIALIIFGLYRWDNEAMFERMEIGDKYVLSQLVIKRPFLRTPSAAADFTALQDIKDPTEVVAVFYAADGNRLGSASSMLSQPMTKNQATTLNFTFDGSPMLTNLGQVRVEVKPVSLLQLMDKVTEKANKLPLLK